eukprot:353716-Chlamydomonas_euryale.AAC.4
MKLCLRMASLRMVASFPSRRTGFQGTSRCRRTNFGPGSSGPGPHKCGLTQLYHQAWQQRTARATPRPHTRCSDHRCATRGDTPVHGCITIAAVRAVRRVSMQLRVASVRRGSPAVPRGAPTAPRRSVGRTRAARLAAVAASAARNEADAAAVAAAAASGGLSRRHLLAATTASGFVLPGMLVGAASPGGCTRR